LLTHRSTVKLSLFLSQGADTGAKKGKERSIFDSSSIARGADRPSPAIASRSRLIVNQPRFAGTGASSSLLPSPPAVEGGRDHTRSDRDEIYRACAVQDQDRSAGDRAEDHDGA